MSRGYGKLQWRLLTILSEHERTKGWREELDTLTLARRVHRREPTRAQLVSIRRALAVLTRYGEVENFGRRFDHRHRWVLSKR